MYKATVRFREVADAGHIYEIGDDYPREGYSPADKRIEQLLSGSNKAGYPVIAEILDEDEVEEKPLSRMNKTELLEKADEVGVDVPNGAKNKDIVALIEAALKNKE